MHQGLTLTSLGQHRIPGNRPWLTPNQKWGQPDDLRSLQVLHLNIYELAGIQHIDTRLIPLKICRIGMVLYSRLVPIEQVKCRSEGCRSEGGQMHLSMNSKWSQKHLKPMSLTQAQRPLNFMSHKGLNWLRIIEGGVNLAVPILHIKDGLHWLIIGRFLRNWLILGECKLSPSIFWLGSFVHQIEHSLAGGLRWVLKQHNQRTRGYLFTHQNNAKGNLLKISYVQVDGWMNRIYRWKASLTPHISYNYRWHFALNSSPPGHC